MSVDFFVHPEVPAFTPEKDTGYGDYIKALLDEARASEYPIGVEGIEQHYPQITAGAFRDRAPERPWLRSIACAIEHRNSTTVGAIRPQDWSQLTELLKGMEADEIRIHGSYYKQCTISLGIQLSAYLEENEHLYNWQLDEEHIAEAVTSDLNKMLAYESDGLFSDSNVHLGITLADPEDPEVVESDSQDFKDRVTSQLSDAQTSTYRLGPEVS